MESVINEKNPTVHIDFSESEEDICTSSSRRRSTGANKRKRGGNERKISEGAIYSFMRFPRNFATEAVSPVIHSRQASISTCDIKFPMLLGLIDTDSLESLVSLTSDIAAKRLKTDKTVSIKQMKAALYKNILLRIAYSAAEARFLDCSSFRLLDNIFTEFASFWMNMRDEGKTTEEQESQQYNFKPCAVEIGNIFEIDMSTRGSILPNEIFSECHEFLSKEESTDKKKGEAGDEALEDEWNFLQESILKEIVHIHNSLFGSEDLLRSPGSIEISEADSLSLFEDSYSLGVKMIESLEGALPYSLDAKLSPEHLLHLSLSLDYEKNFILSHKSTRAYNFYKDSNAPVMAKMMELLATLKEHISILMTERDDHPALQKILDVIDMIFGIPLSTPLAKALMALQFLLSRVQIMQVTVSRFSLSDQREPILALVLSWKKLEFESWTALLDEVQLQYEINAGKLWFPLYSVLHRTHPADLKKYSDLTSQSLEEYIKASNIGEFRKRLQLLFAMHGQIKTGITQSFYSSPFQSENEKILYNIFGLYVQFLPRILDYIHAVRKNIELELEEFVKLCRLERSDAYLTDNSKIIRQEFMKIIQKYNDLLQQPLMIILKQEADRRGMAGQTVQDSSPRVTFDKNLNILKDLFFRFTDEDWSARIDTWKTKTDAAIQNLQVVRTTEFVFPHSSFKSIEEVARIIKECVSSPSFCTGYKEERRKVWEIIRKIYNCAVACGEFWNDVNTTMNMRWTLSGGLFRILDSCGLSKLAPAFCEDGQLAQPSFNMQHLLLTDGMTSENNNEKIQTSPLDRLETEWRYANQHFFRSISSVRQLKHIGCNFHKDFTLEQVMQSISYLDHLIAIQQEQRAAAYDFAARLEILKKSILPLDNVFSSPDPFASDSRSFPKNQHATFNCMWQQKQLFDGLCALLRDKCLLLRTVENSHPDTCQRFPVVTKRLLLFFEEFAQNFKKSKDSLDNYLLGKDRIITSIEVKLQPNGVTKQMEQLVLENFSMIREFKERASAFRKRDVDPESAAEILFGHLESIFIKEKSIAEEYESSLRARNHSEHMDEDSNRSISGFVQALEQTFKGIMDSFSKLGSSNSLSVTKKSLENICMWKAIFESNISSLKLEEICDGLVKTIQFAGDIVNSNGSENPGHAAYLKHLYSLLDPILKYGDCLLLDFVVMHRAVSQVTDELAKMLLVLYSQGYPTCTKKQREQVHVYRKEPDIREEIPNIERILDRILWS